jgi:hypothetical protein
MVLRWDLKDRWKWFRGAINDEANHVGNLHHRRKQKLLAASSIHTGPTSKLILQKNILTRFNPPKA